MGKGGYKIIDLKDTNFTINGDAVEVPGIYESIESNYRKPTMLANITLNGVERTDRYAVFGVSDGNYVSTVTISEDIAILQCTIYPNDTVQFIEV